MKRHGLGSKGASRGWSAWCMGTVTDGRAAGGGRTRRATQHDRCILDKTCPCNCHRKKLGRVRWMANGDLAIVCYECKGRSRYKGISKHGTHRSMQLLQRGWVNSSYTAGLCGGGGKIRWRHIQCAIQSSSD